MLDTIAELFTTECIVQIACGGWIDGENACLTKIHPFGIFFLWNAPMVVAEWQTLDHLVVHEQKSNEGSERHDVRTSSENSSSRTSFSMRMALL